MIDMFGLMKCNKNSFYQYSLYVFASEYINGYSVSGTTFQTLKKKKSQTIKNAENRCGKKIMNTTSGNANDQIL